MIFEQISIDATLSA